MNKVLNKIIEYGIYFLVFILPLQTRWIMKAGEFNGAYTEYFTYSLYGFDVLLFVLLILQLVNTLIYNQKKKIRIPLLWTLIGIFEFICFVSIFFALDKSLAIFVYIRFVLVLGLFYLIIRSEFDKYKIIVTLVITATLQALLAIWQFASQSSFASKWFGMSAHDPAELGVSVIEAIGVNGQMERWLRAYGSLDHPNILGGFLAFALIAIIYIKIKKYKSKRIELFLMIVFPVIIFALSFSFSRSACLGLVFGIGLMTVIAIKRRALYPQKIIAESILIISIIFFVSYSIYPNLFNSRVNANTRLENISNNERLASIDTANTISNEHLGIGVGIGNYVEAQKKTENIKYSYQLQPVHNIFLLIKSELGIFGILMFLIILMYYLQIIIKSKENIYLIGGFMIIFSIFMFDHWLWTLHFGLMLLALFGGITIRFIYNK